MFANVEDNDTWINEPLGIHIDNNPSPDVFTTIEAKDEHKKRYGAILAGFWQFDRIPLDVLPNIDQVHYDQILAKELPPLPMIIQRKSITKSKNYEQAIDEGILKPYAFRTDPTTGEHYLEVCSYGEYVDQFFKYRNHADNSSEELNSAFLYKVFPLKD